MTAYEKIRNTAGLVDLDNWVRIEVSGPDAVDALDSVVGGNVTDLFEGRAMNTLIPSLDGGVEAILWLLATETGFVIVAEPEERTAIQGVLAQLDNFDIATRDLSDRRYHMVLTGPAAEAIAGSVLGDEISSIAFLNTFELASGETAARIGFFGEYELHLFGEADAKSDLVARITAEAGDDILTDQSAFGVMMAEMRILSRARDVVPGASLFATGLQWMVDFSKDNLRGAEAIASRRDETGQSCVLMVMEGAPQTGAIKIEGAEVGFVQSAYHSDTLGRTVALAYLDADLAAPGLRIETGAGLAETVSAPAFLSKSVLSAMGQAA